MKNLSNTYKVGGFIFRYDQELKSYEARGHEIVDDYGDRRPENALLDAAKELQKKLESAGYMADWDFGEKGWVYVSI